MVSINNPLYAAPDAPTAKDIGLYDNVGKGGDKAQTAPGTGQFWQTLKRTNKCYDGLRIQKECLLYEGGFQMNDKEVAKLFCPKLKDDEDDDAFTRRVKSAAYVPTFSKLITGLISTLFSQDLAVMEASDHDDPNTAGEEFTDNLRDFYKLFVKDCDGNGTSLHNFMKDRTTRALIHQRCYFGVDYDKPEVQPQNLLEQEQLGLDKPRLYKIDGSTIYDWQMKEGSAHCFEWLKILHCIQFQPTPFDLPLVKYEIKTWQMENGVATYKTYLTRAVKDFKDLKDKEIIPMVDEGATSFKEIPVFCFYLDDGIAVGAKLAPMAAEQFNRTTIENHMTNVACISVPVVYRGNMLPGDHSLPSITQMDGQRGQHPRAQVNNKGILELGSKNEDLFDIVESDAKALMFIHQQNEDIDEKMHSVVHQMGQSLKQSRSKSGKSAATKVEERRGTEMLLTAIADEVYQMVLCVFNVIAESRGEDLMLEAKGLSTVSSEDRDELNLEVTGLPAALQAINSPTFGKEYMYRIASRLIDGTDQATLQTMREEIEGMVDKLGAATLGANASAGGDMSNGTGTKTNPSKPQPKVNSKGGSDMTPSQQAQTSPAVSASGNKALDVGSHTQTGQHVDPKVVYDMMLKDYKPKDLQWLKTSVIRGPVEVDINDISFNGEEDWTASKPGPQGQEKVDEFAEIMSDKGFTTLKPVVLANMPHNDEKYTIIDGRHRVKAAQQAGLPVLAYVVDVGSMDADTPHMKLHGKQIGSNNSSGGS